MHHHISHMLRGAVTLLLVAATGMASAQSARFRIGDLDLRDPHLFVSFIGCVDATETFNTRVQTLLQTDADTPPDGMLDLSYLIEFVPLDQSAATNLMQLGASTCQGPLASPTCGPITSSGLGGDAALSTSSVCLESVAGTVRPYTPAVPIVAPLCFVSPAATLTLDLGLVSIALHDSQIAATFVDTPATALAPGLIRGFLTETDANATLIPADVPLIGGQTLSALLPGGIGNCAGHSDKDVHEGVPGWWMYLQYNAPRLVEEDPFPEGFSDGFEE